MRLKIVEDERTARLVLQRLRQLATILQKTERVEKLAYGKFPLLQAEEIMTDRLGTYKLACTELTFERTNKQVISKLKKRFSPHEVLREVSMPITKFLLKAHECNMIEAGYRLPKWKRPQWLEEVGQGQVIITRDGDEFHITLNPEN